MRTLYQKLAERLHSIEDHLTVRTQIAAAIAMMSILVVGTLAAGAAWVSYSNTSKLVNRSLAGIASTTAGRLDRYMEVRQQEMTLFSQLQPLQRLWQSDPVELRHALEQLQNSFSDFAWIGFADPDGHVVASTGGLLQGSSVAARPWFKAGLQRLVVGDVHEAILLSSLLAQRASNEPYRFVDLGMPVRDANGKLLGVLGGHLNFDWATNLISNVEANDGGADTTLSIIDKSGTVLVGPDKGQVKYSGEKLAELLRARQGTFAEKPGQERLLTAFYVSNGHREYQGLNWIVTASQPASVALAAAGSSAEIILFIGAVVGLMGLAFAVFISRRIAGPILAITQEADRIGRAFGPSMLARQSGSMEVVRLSRALRSLLRRIGFAEERTREAELRATENALQMEADIIKLRQLADTDFMTGLLNRRAFLPLADDALEFCRRYKRSMATLMIDIDHFKKINDTYGHGAGDHVIKAIADIVNAKIRGTDKAARFGGEEFVVLLRELDQETAMMLAERIRVAIEQAPISHGDKAIPVTASIGVSMFTEGDRDVQDLIERADQGLYNAKKTGRNRISLAPAAEARPALVA
jgi:diguanylate cyclase (GGDEF)-like protein